MRKELVEHAIKNVWCSPRQDRQYILQLAKLTPFLGSKGTVKVLWDSIELPTQKEYYHVYQLGKSFPEIFGLDPTEAQWRSVAEMCESTKLIVNLYLDSGVNFPLTESWLRMNYDGNLILAVKIQNTMASLENVELYMRVYSNAYFESDLAIGSVDEIRVGGGKLLDVDQYLSVYNEYLSYKNKEVGGVYAFFNGYYVERLLPNQWVKGDVFEWVYDSTIREVVSWDVSKLDSFESTLDKQFKYLLHPPKHVGQQIDYRDDIDFWLCRDLGDTGMKGVMVHKNQDTTIRNVTHADYSLSVQVVQALNGANPFIEYADYGKIVAFVRKSGYDRPLVFEQQRIHELYKLDDAKIVAAMYGRHATVPEWQAAALEASAYCALMREPDFEKITYETVVDAYGYNALSVLTANSPLRPIETPNFRRVTLPIGLRDGCTAFEYDSEGLLLQANYNSGGLEYVLEDQDRTALVELYGGKGGLGYETWFGGDPVTIGTDCGFRVFKTAKGYPTGLRDWADVTDAVGSEYALSNGVITPLNARIYDYLVVSDRRFLLYGLKLDYPDHLLKFSIQATDTDGEFTPMEWEPGRIVIWLNKHRLIEGLDYVVKFPQVVITNKTWLDQTQDAQDILVCCTGFSHNGVRESTGEFGFVRHGLLSDNNRFDIRDDKVISCVVDGRVLHRDQLKFREDSSAVDLTAVVRDGAPYQLSELYVPIRGITDYDTQVLRKEAIAIDQRVADYLSNWLPEPELDPTHSITHLHWLYSPFFAKVLWDLRNGILSVTKLFRSDKQILEELESYRWLLDYDPTQLDIDSRYVNIHPHHSTNTLRVTQAQWAYLVRVNRLFLGSKVAMSQFLFVVDKE